MIRVTYKRYGCCWEDLGNGRRRFHLGEFVAWVTFRSRPQMSVRVRPSGYREAEIASAESMRDRLSSPSHNEQYTRQAAV